ncbi:hypothetical protein B0J14DRAFT_572601 [Halenospora varia]|nr:hypothetical protein B0J14DRAFT_572601 [Halenospora varia]
MNCPTTKNLDRGLFNNVCIQNARLNETVKTGMHTCCSQNSVPIVATSDKCYTYCNVTDSSQAGKMLSCLQTLYTGLQLTTGDVSNLDQNCVGDIVTTAKTTSNSTQPSNTTSTIASPSKSATGTQTSSTAAATTKPSSASGGAVISKGALIVLGLAMFGLWV